MMHSMMDPLIHMIVHFINYTCSLQQKSRRSLVDDPSTRHKLNVGRELNISRERSLWLPIQFHQAPDLAITE